MPVPLTPPLDWSTPLRPLVLLLLLSALLSACITVKADEAPKGRYDAPEDAVFEWANQQPPAVINSFVIWQVAALDNGYALVLASLRPEGWTHERPALSLFVVERTGGRWLLHPPSFGQAMEAAPGGIASYTIGPDDGLPFPVAYGQIFDERANQVTVSWTDKVEQQVDVVHRSFLSVRGEGERVSGTRAVAYDPMGRPLAESVPLNP